MPQTPERRRFVQQAAHSVLAGYGLLGCWPVQALTLADLSVQEASAGIKVALEKGALVAVDMLGRPGGFLDNPKVHIPLPGYLEDVGRLMSSLGQGQKVQDLQVAINRAAEAAVPMGRDLLLQAVRTMTVSDAKRILTGGDTSVTEFFAARTREPLTERFLPVATQAMQKVALAEKYNALAKRAARFGLIKSEDAHLDRYVTAKTLDGLYLVIGEEERKMRKDPVGTGSRLIEKVFGTLK